MYCQMVTKCYTGQYTFFPKKSQGIILLLPRLGGLKPRTKGREHEFQSPRTLFIAPSEGKSNTLL